MRAPLSRAVSRVSDTDYRRSAHGRRSDLEGKRHRSSPARIEQPSGSPTIGGVARDRHGCLAPFLPNEPTALMPELHAENLRLTDFMDVQTLQEIQDSFAAVANVKAVITDADGNRLTQPAPTREFLKRQQT